MNEREYELRMAVFELGRKLRLYEYDQEDIEDIGTELIVLSSVCPNCCGEGIEGDPPDEAGVGGAIFQCSKCNGSVFVMPEDRSQHLGVSHE